MGAVSRSGQGSCAARRDSARRTPLTNPAAPAARFDGTWSRASATEVATAARAGTALRSSCSAPSRSTRRSVGSTSARGRVSTCASAQSSVPSQRTVS
jgi:hypothetical protein